MARIRTVKPEFFRSYELYMREADANRERAEMPYLNIRVAFLGIITAADRMGRFKWKPEELKLDTLPHDPVDFTEVMGVLAAGPDPFIVRYEVEGKPFGYIPGFLTHQRPKVDEAQSVIPPPNGGLLDSERTPAGLQSAQGKEGKGKEGEEGAAPRPRFTLPTVADVNAYCRERNNGVNPQRFIDYYTANGWKVGRNPMKDWRAAVRTWEQRDPAAAPKPKQETRLLCSDCNKALPINGEELCQACKKERMAPLPKLPTAKGMPRYKNTTSAEALRKAAYRDPDFADKAGEF